MSRKNLRMAAKSSTLEFSSRIPPELSGFLSLSELRRDSSIGYIYESICSCGVRYVGMSERLDEKSIATYAGSGGRWMAHQNSHRIHSVSKVLHCWSSDSTELRSAELTLIQSRSENFKENLMNLRMDQPQGNSCAECGSFGRHRVSCSLYRAPSARTPACDECSGKAGHHRKPCSRYRRKLATCAECGTLAPEHRRDCSRKVICSECGSLNSRVHFRQCAFYREPRGQCPECAGRLGKHRKHCGKFVPRQPCEQCGSRSNHRKDCGGR